MSKAQELAGNLKSLSTGTSEWRVQHPIEKSYCMSANRRDNLNPEREMREWLADHKARHPDSQFAGYEVAEVRCFSRLERVAHDAADELLRLEAEVVELRSTYETANLLGAEVINDRNEKIKRLEAENRLLQERHHSDTLIYTELLEALKGLANVHQQGRVTPTEGSHGYVEMHVQNAEAAIAKHGGGA